jgi:hypothetical protein
LVFVPVRLERSGFLDLLRRVFFCALHDLLPRSLDSALVRGGARPEWRARPAASMGRDVGATGLLFEVAVKGDAHVDACTHECAAQDTAYDGALEAEPRHLKQTRNFLLHQRASAEQTFQGRCVRRCDARAAHAAGYQQGEPQNLPSPIQFQTHWYRT